MDQRSPAARPFHGCAPPSDGAGPTRGGEAGAPPGRPGDAALLGLRSCILWMVRNETLAADLPLRQIAALTVLTTQPRAMSCSALAEALGVSRVAVTRATTSLAEMGLVRQRQNPKDRRVTLLSATGRGAQLAQLLAAALGEGRHPGPDA
jgi:DNA-binding MarR family transcriptional regulator